MLRMMELQPSGYSKMDLGCKDLSSVALKNGECLSICHGNSDRALIDLRRVINEKRAVYLKIRLVKASKILSRLTSEYWVASVSI